jgi:hypothetical protein
MGIAWCDRLAVDEAIFVDASVDRVAVGGRERQQWAVSTKRRQHAKVQPKVSSKQQIQPVPMLSLAYAYKQPSAATH